VINAIPAHRALTGLVDQQVARLEVAVDELAAVGVVRNVCDRDAPFGRLAETGAPAGQPGPFSTFPALPVTCGFLVFFEGRGRARLS
jgi:hypothetical protein